MHSGWSEGHIRCPVFRLACIQAGLQATYSVLCSDWLAGHIQCHVFRLACRSHTASCVQTGLQVTYSVLRSGWLAGHIQCPARNLTVVFWFCPGRRLTLFKQRTKVLLLMYRKPCFLDQFLSVAILSSLLSFLFCFLLFVC